MITKKEIARSIAEENEISIKKAEGIVNSVFEKIATELAEGEEGKVSIAGFGTFEVRERGEKKCVNPRTKEEMVCPPTIVPAFKASKTLKDSIKNRK